MVAEIAVASGHEIVGFVDDDPIAHGERILDWVVLGDRSIIPNGANVALGIGNNAVRKEILNYGAMYQWSIVSLFHPTAVISPSSSIGEGTIVMAQVVVNARASIGRGCILNTSCSVDHDCYVGNMVHICPGAHLAGAVQVGDGTMVGIGSCVKQGIVIGTECIIGAGSVVISDISDNVTVYGNPAHMRPK